MSSPARYTIDNITQGSDWSLALTWLVDNEPVDLTNYTGAMQLRSKPAGELIADVTVTLGGEDGTILLELSDPNYELPPGTYVYDLQLSAVGTRTTLLYGNASITAAVTEMLAP
jgi:hypothetical protein